MAKLFSLAGIALVSLAIPSSLLAAGGPLGSVLPCDCQDEAFSGTGIYYGSGSPEPPTAPPSDRALVILGLPDASAEVYVEGVLTGTPGRKRHYLTPPLEANKIYFYEIKVVHILAVEPVDEVLFDTELVVENKLKVPVIAGTVTKVRATVDEQSKLILLFAPTEEDLKLKIKPKVPPIDVPDPKAPKDDDDKDALEV